MPVGAIIAGLGMIAEGVGTGIAGTTQGTAECGSQPACAFTKACKERKSEWQDCVNRQQDIVQQSLVLDNEQKKVAEENRAKRNKIIIIGVISAITLGIIIILIRKRKK